MQSPDLVCQRGNGVISSSLQSCSLDIRNRDAIGDSKANLHKYLGFEQVIAHFGNPGELRVRIKHHVVADPLVVNINPFDGEVVAERPLEPPAVCPLKYTCFRSGKYS
jgi:hypothetical protein